MQKIIGVPQNRERVFIISIRDDVANCNFCFPPKIPLTTVLRDILEKNVEEKYYLSNKGVWRLIVKNNKLIREKCKNPEVSRCIMAGYNNQDGRDGQFISDKLKVKRIMGLYDSKNNKHQAGSIYSPNGISPTLTTMEDGGSKQPFILVKEGTKKGYTEATIEDSINVSYPKSTTKRGRVGKKVSQTILSSPSIAVLENVDKPVCLTHNKMSMSDRVYDTNGIATSVMSSNFRTNIAEIVMFNPYNNKEIKDIAPTQTTNCGSTNSSATVLISEDGRHFFRIRKLTPLECWRLMGFDDKDFYKAKEVGISDSQLYRQAGNSIVVNVLEHIFEELLIENELQKCA